MCVCVCICNTVFYGKIIYKTDDRIGEKLTVPKWCRLCAYAIQT